jgi:YD repeat-containing protein
MLNRYGSQQLVAAIILFVIAGVAARIGPAYAGTPSFVYDNGDRLLAAFDGNGNVANYQYDKAGNITAIVTGSASAVAVFGYSPDHGAGDNFQVTIFGNGFSTTPSQNTVTIGTQQMTVISSTQSQIVAKPVGSIPTAPIVVTTPSGSATGPLFYVP